MVLHFQITQTGLISVERQQMTQRIATGAVMLALAMAPAQRVMADGGDFALGVAAGVIGSAVVRDMKKKNQAKAQTTYSQPATTSTSGSKAASANSAQREQNRQVQTALNYFAFPVGTPDGVLGRKSQAGIAEFQNYMGYPVTGQLTLAQQDFLLTSFNRAQAGGAATNEAIASNAQGVRGLLTDYAGQLAPVTAGAAAVTTQGKIPSFMAAGTGGGSLSAFCAGPVPGGAAPVSAAGRMRPRCWPSSSAWPATRPWPRASALPRRCRASPPTRSPRNAATSARSCQTM